MAYRADHCRDVVPVDPESLVGIDTSVVIYIGLRDAIDVEKHSAFSTRDNIHSRTPFVNPNCRRCVTRHTDNGTEHHSVRPSCATPTGVALRSRADTRPVATPWGCWSHSSWLWWLSLGYLHQGQYSENGEHPLDVVLLVEVDHPEEDYRDPNCLYQTHKKPLSLISSNLFLCCFNINSIIVLSQPIRSSTL